MVRLISQDPEIELFELRAIKSVLRRLFSSEYQFCWDYIRGAVSPTSRSLNGKPVRIIIASRWDYFGKLLLLASHLLHDAYDAPSFYRTLQQLETADSVQVQFLTANPKLRAHDNTHYTPTTADVAVCL